MRFDFIIIGGGMVGAALACALKASNRSVALIDASPINNFEDHRLIALTYSSYTLFKNLNIWQNLQSHAEKILAVHVSQSGKFGRVLLNHAELNLPCLGYTVPAKYINKALYENLNTVTLFRPAKLIKMEQNSDYVTLEIETPTGIKKLSTNFVIGADGSHSTVRELSNIKFDKYDYKQSALVTVTHLKRPHQNIAYERFLKNGALAMLPLIDNKVATIWSANNEEINYLMHLNVEDFINELQKHFGYRLGNFVNIEKRYCYPLTFIKAHELHVGRIILIGNAAHTLHPIAAQGLNLSLYEVAALAEHFNNTSIDLLNFKNFILSQQKISTQLSHTLALAFSKDFFIMRNTKQLGMLALEMCPSLKEYFAKKTIGLSGRIPYLLREKRIA